MVVSSPKLAGLSGSDDVVCILNALARGGFQVAQRLKTALHAAAETGQRNVQGESVKEMDQVADRIFSDILQTTNGCAALISEERETELAIGKGNYLVAIDPLDGSSNLDSTVPVGSIFGVYLGADSWERSLNQNLKIVAAGFVSYGILPAMYLSVSGDLLQYKLNWASTSWELVNSKITMPEKPGVFSCNEGNAEKWSPEDREFLMRLRNEIGSCRYSGSLVADCEKILLKGGVFAYPKDSKSPDGKLRLFYECMPMTAIMAAAGGAGSDGSRSILQVQPKKIHQRTPVFLGNRALLSGRV